MRKVSAIILSISLFAALTGCGGNTYTISVPDASQVAAIELTESGRSVAVNDEMGINIIVNALRNVNSQTKNESIQDYPVNAEDIIYVDMTLKDESHFSVFVYERRDRYYMEQPYNGIYSMKERDHDTVEDFMD